MKDDTQELTLFDNYDLSEKIWYVQGEDVGLKGGYIFYYEKKGKRISQFHMSTGENLLISILNSISIRKKERDNIEKPCMFFLDEVELALHPSSLKKLMTLLTQVSDEYNYAIYFSTHSIELIRGIKPENIFYIERHSDNSLEVLNPCYPAYATKFLYDHSGYDRIILVEDDLAKEIIRRILKKESMMNNKLVHVLPCGGWNNVLDLADDVIRNNLLGKRASICIILDGDIKDQADKYRKKIHNSIPTNYLPIKSLEKYLRSKLVLSVDHKLYRHLTDYIFQQKSLAEIIDEYKRISRYDWEKDSNGKTFYSLLNDELQKRNKDRAELIETIVDYLFDQHSPELISIIAFLHNQLD